MMERQLREFRENKLQIRAGIEGGLVALVTVGFMMYPLIVTALYGFKAAVLAGFMAVIGYQYLAINGALDAGGDV